MGVRDTYTLAAMLFKLIELTYFYCANDEVDFSAMVDYYIPKKGVYRNSAEIPRNIRWLYV